MQTLKQIREIIAKGLLSESLVFICAPEVVVQHSIEYTKKYVSDILRDTANNKARAEKSKVHTEDVLEESEEAEESGESEKSEDFVADENIDNLINDTSEPQEIIIDVTSIDSVNLLDVEDFIEMLSPDNYEDIDDKNISAAVEKMSIAHSKTIQNLADIERTIRKGVVYDTDSDLKNLRYRRRVITGEYRVVTAYKPKIDEIAFVIKNYKKYVGKTSFLICFTNFKDYINFKNKMPFIKKTKKYTYIDNMFMSAYAREEYVLEMIMYYNIKFESEKVKSKFIENVSSDFDESLNVVKAAALEELVTAEYVNLNTKHTEHVTYTAALEELIKYKTPGKKGNKETGSRRTLKLNSKVLREKMELLLKLKLMYVHGISYPGESLKMISLRIQKLPDIGRDAAKYVFLSEINKREFAIMTQFCVKYTLADILHARTALTAMYTGSNKPPVEAYKFVAASNSLSMMYDMYEKGEL